MPHHLLSCGRRAIVPSGDLMLMKYKAVLELEQYSDLDMALDIAANLGCYDFSPDVLSPDAYGEYVLQSAGIDTGDPAFSCFDFRCLCDPAGIKGFLTDRQECPP